MIDALDQMHRLKGASPQGETLTRDAARYRTYFPHLLIIAPICSLSSPEN